jgi:hypothetical protein
MNQDSSHNPLVDKDRDSDNESSFTDKHSSDNDSNDSQSEKLANNFNERIEIIIPKRDYQNKINL